MTMRDCPNAAMRDALPLLASGRLDAIARSAVETHVAGCADCAAELAVLRAAHAAYPVPGFDATRVAAGVVAGTVRRQRSNREMPYYRQPLWRIAAGLTLLIAGAAATVLVRNGNPGAMLGPEITVVDTAVPSLADGSIAVAGTRPVASSTVGFGIHLDGLTDAEVEALLASLDAIEGNVLADPELLARPIVPESGMPESGRN